MSDSDRRPHRIDCRREYDGYFKIDKAVFSVPGRDGVSSRTLTRYIFERGDAAAILLHDPVRRTVVLVQQIRFPVLMREEDGMFLEIVAGSMTPGEDPGPVAVKETLEETGVTIREPGYLGMIYLSPGGSSERCFLFEKAVDSKSLHGRMGGEEGTDEETRVVVIPVEEVAGMIRNGGLRDAKTVVAIQKLLLGEVPGWDIEV